MGRIILSRKGFECGYCQKRKKGPYKWVDGYRSCEACNRAYDAPSPKPRQVSCPICNGNGFLQSK